MYELTQQKIDDFARILHDHGCMLRCDKETAVYLNHFVLTVKVRPRNSV